MHGYIVVALIVAGVYLAYTLRNKYRNKVVAPPKETPPYPPVLEEGEPREPADHTK